MDIQAFATKQLSLLQAEVEAEAAETSNAVSQSAPTTLQRCGLAILNLTLSAQRTGLGGKTVVELSPDGATGGGGEIAPHGIRTGDIVSVQEQPAGSARKKELEGMRSRGVEGVVTRVTPSMVLVALDKEDQEPGQGRLWVYANPPVKLANEVTYKRMNQVMTRLQKMGEAEYSPLVRVLFGLGSPSPVRQLEQDVEWVDASLNESQKDAVKFAMGSGEVALIHGPPGTGKTHTVIELILQLLKQDKRMLVCGPSNISVDNIVERLAPHRVPIVRLGHPARLLPSVLNHSLDVLTRTSEAAEIVRDVRKEMDAKQASIRKTRSGRERKAIYTDLKELRREYRQREGKCTSTLVGGSKVVLSTLHGAGGFQLRHEHFDVVIIDEASQALEAQCWIPLLSAEKVVLAGDHLQLPPTIKAQRTAGLEKTMFDRLLSLHGPSIKRMLTTQYRMHDTIMRFPSQELYESHLVAADNVKKRLLVDLPYEVEGTDDTKEPLVFFDTQGGDFPEVTEDEQTSKSSLLGDSKSNPTEAGLVKIHLEGLVDVGVRPEDIAVITPYNAQLGLLSSMLKSTYPALELGSVDGFQGREKEAVIVSLVRSNPTGEVGFLAEKRRLNVAMTRPKRHLCVIGDAETVGGGSPFLKRWMTFLEEVADLRYPDVGDVIES